MFGLQPSRHISTLPNDESERLLIRPLVASPIEDALKRVIRVACREREQRRAGPELELHDVRRPEYRIGASLPSTVQVQH
jgi:hypothetical protein